MIFGLIYTQEISQKGVMLSLNIQSEDREEAVLLDMEEFVTWEKALQ